MRWGRALPVALAVWIGGCSHLDTSPAPSEKRTSAAHYPAHWWAAVPRRDAASWEILPRDAGPGEVILSKRNELGLLSNFAHTPFVFHGTRYPSLEGFWQMMKYPEGPEDGRTKFPGITWPHTRQEVSQMVGAEAKAAGSLATRNMKAMGIDWVTFEGTRMPYRTQERGPHYDLIVEATWAKVRQNPNVRDVLLSTGNLVLRPDHHQDPDAPPAWRYHEIMMMIRDSLRDNINRPGAQSGPAGQRCPAGPRVQREQTAGLASPAHGRYGHNSRPVGVQKIGGP